MPSFLSNTAKLGKCFLRMRYNVQCIGNNDNIKGLVSIRQMEHILHGKIQLEEKLPRFACAIIAAEASVASMWSAEHRRCFCHLPCAGGYLPQNGFVPHSRAKQRI